VRLETFEDEESLARRSGALVVEALELGVERTGLAHLALSGGRTPERAYELIGREPVMAHVAIWLVDERCVPPEHPDSNYAMIRRTLLDGGLVPAERVHPMQGELGPREGAEQYAQELRAHLGDRPRLDATVLGIGPDGHTASLFPGRATLEMDGLALPVEDSPKPPPERITLSLGVLRDAALNVMIVTGEEKAAALAAMFGPPSAECPASLLERDRVAVVADRDASGLLDARR